MGSLTKEMMIVLKKYGWSSNEEIIKEILCEWEKVKAPLISLLSKHPNWRKEKNYIVFDTDYEREFDPEGIRAYRGWFEDQLCSNGDKINFILKDHDRIIRNYYNPLNCISHTFSVLLDAENALDVYCNASQEEWLKCYFPEFKCKAGQKKTRILNKIAHLIELDQHPDYNREFAKFCDALSPMKYQRHTIISVNPIDYLLMAHGNSWSSCMTIDVDQKEQNSYNGERANGVFSYMLDPSTFIFYTVDAKFDGTDYELEPKINRMLFHYGNYKLVQGRLYPQSNDGAIGAKLRERIRNIVQKIVADCLEEPNLWILSDFDYPTDHVYTRPNSVHYPDYHYSDRNNITLSTLKVDTKEKLLTQKRRFEIGADAYCIQCGDVNMSQSNLICEDCRARQDECTENSENNRFVYTYTGVAF